MALTCEGAITGFNQIGAFFRSTLQDRSGGIAELLHETGHGASRNISSATEPKTSLRSLCAHASQARPDQCSSLEPMSEARPPPLLRRL